MNAFNAVSTDELAKVEGGVDPLEAVGALIIIAGAAIATYGAVKGIMDSGGNAGQSVAQTLAAHKPQAQ